MADSNKGREGPSQGPNFAPLMHGVVDGEHKVVDRAPHACSFCGRLFPTLQSLGGHMTSHRSELDLMRKHHEFHLACQQLKIAPPTTSHEVMPPLKQEDISSPATKSREATSGIPMEPLTPNYAYWEMYRRTGHPPPFYNFMETKHPN